MKSESAMDQDNRERWVSIAPFFGAYEVSNLGRVRSAQRMSRSPKRAGQTIPAKLLKPGRSSTGYLSVALCRDGKPRTHNIHALVAAAFIGERPDGYDIDHIDGDRQNNLPANLRYVTHKMNTRNITVANSSSGVVGVYRNGPGWMAQARMDGVTFHLGTFPTIEAAAEVRADFERKHDFKGLNAIQA